MPIGGKDYGTLEGGLVALGAAEKRFLEPKVLKTLLLPMRWHSAHFVLDDFAGRSLDTSLWATAAGTGGTAFAVPAEASALAGLSVARGATGTTSGTVVSLRGQPFWLGDKNAGMAIRWRASAATSLGFEIGFTDPLTSYTAKTVTDIDIPTIGNGAVTVALLARDPSQTLTTAALVLDGDATYPTSKIDLGTWAPSAATWYTTIIQLAQDAVRVLVYDTSDPSRPALVNGGDKSSGNAYEGGTAVLPYAAFYNTSAANIDIDVDFVAVWSDR
jgi:hypothetical protein